MIKPQLHNNIFENLDKKIENQRQKEHLKNRIKTQSFQRSTVRFIADFSTETINALGELNDILKVLNKIFFQPRILYKARKNEVE